MRGPRPCFPHTRGTSDPAAASGWHSRRLPLSPGPCIVGEARHRETRETCGTLMRIYLDNCCFSRPFDDQGQVRIRLETEAKLAIQQWVSDGKFELVWSYMLDFENFANPFDERREAVSEWKARAVADVEESAQLLATARSLEERGLRPCVRRTPCMWPAPWTAAARASSLPTIGW